MILKGRKEKEGEFARGDDEEKNMQRLTTTNRRYVSKSEIEPLHCVSVRDKSVREVLMEMEGEIIRAHHWHRVKFIKDLKTDGEKEVICGVCEDPVSGGGYKCSRCNFLCHQSCAELPVEIKQHPLHPNHTLFGGFPSRFAYCDACGKSCRRSHFYSCTECEFNLHSKCCTRWQLKKIDCDQHTFVPFQKQIQSTCEGCGEQGNDIGLICNKCQLLTHTRCALFLRAIRVTGHEHLLTLTYSIQEVKEQANLVCGVCSEKVNAKYAAYYCQHCNYVAHLRCARDCLIEGDGDVSDDSASNVINQLFSEGYLLGLIQDMNQAVNERDLFEKIQHFSHSHDLILNYEEVLNDKICDACMQLISIPFYSCEECNYFLHSLCARIPTELTHNYIPFPITMLSQAPTTNGVFQCYFCNQHRHGFTCTPEGRNWFADIQCLKMEKFQHKGHQHPFAIQRGRTCMFCAEEAYFVCSRADFGLWHRCISLPLTVSYKDDEHPLELTYSIEDKYEEYYYLVCEEKKDPNYWFYYCTKCDFVSHLQCTIGEFLYIKIEKTYKDKRHQHPLTFVQKTSDSYTCDACGLLFGDVFLQCKKCKKKIHPRFGFNSSTCLELKDDYLKKGKYEDEDEDEDE